MAIHHGGDRACARRATLQAGSLAILLAAVAVSAGPLRYPPLVSNQIRIEGHLMPEVSTGPLDPAWSPDGRWIAFSAKGDIWKVPVAGGEAVALTQGPAYHFEPAWSGDGSQIALSMDVDGNLDIGVVSANGGPVRRLTTDPHVDVEPVWSIDGASIYFVTGRKRSLDIYRIDVATKAESPVIEEPGDQIQPALSPDGRTLAYVSPVQRRVGDGGIWVKPLASGAAELVHFEETSLRTKPAWTGWEGVHLRVRRDRSEPHRRRASGRWQPHTVDDRQRR
jgi:WD40-like Beta Propeller Repeat